MQIKDSFPPVYLIAWLYSIRYKVTDERGYAVTRAIYNMLGVGSEEHIDLLGMYIQNNLGAKFWFSVMIYL